VQGHLATAVKAIKHFFSDQCDQLGRHFAIH
jgi:hypothetical protein